MEKITQLETFIDELSKLDPRVDGVFHEILNKGMGLLEYGDDDCAILFDVSRPTVTRWRNGSTAPHRAMRLPLCNVLKKKAGRRLKLLKQRETPPQRVIAKRKAPAKYNPRSAIA
jgi:hypothetical protein